jgi:putative ABC transport system permease protein
MALITGLTLFAPVLIPPIAHVVAWPLARFPGALGILVRENTLVAVRRTASTAAPVLLTVGLAALFTGVIATFAVAVRQDGIIDARSDTIVLPQGTPGLTDATVAAVDGGQSTLMSFVYTRFPDGSEQRVEVAGVDPDVLPLAPGEIAIASGYADSLGWKPDDTITITFADGIQASMRVTQITDDIDDDALAGGAVLARRIVREHDHSALTEAVFVPSSTSIDVDLDGLGAYLTDAATYADARVAEEARLAKLVVLVLVGLSLAYTSIAIANTLLIATTGRLRDFAVLRLSGATVGQIIAVVAAEAAFAVAIGAALGMAVAWTAVAGVAWGLSKDIGVTIPVTMDWPVTSLVLTGCLLLAVLASMLPARLALRAGTAALAGERE